MKFVAAATTDGQSAAPGTAAASAAAAGGDGLVTAADFAAAMHRVGPSIVRGAAVEVAPVQWQQVGGYAKVKQRLQQAVEWPLQHAGAAAGCLAGWLGDEELVAG